MQEMEKIEGRVMIDNVVIFGANLIHPKMLEVIQYALKKSPEHNLQAIFVSTTGPRDGIGQNLYHAKSFVISLPQIMEDAINVIGSDDDIGLSISAHVWIGQIYTIFHEIHHNVAMKMELGRGKDFLDLGEEWFSAEEVVATEYAQECIEEAVINCNADVPDIINIPWIGERIMDYLVSEIKDDPDFVKSIKERLDKNIVFESKNDIFDSLVEYFKAASEYPEKYEKENEGAATEMVAENPNLFDQKILPGEQRSLFPDNLGGGVSTPNTDEKGGEVGTQATETTNKKGEEPMHDDVHDYLPDEATMDPEECGSVRNDPFSPNFTPPANTNGGDFPGGRNAEQFYTETAQETANALNTTVEAHFKRDDGSVGKSVHTPTPEANAAAKQVVMGLYQRLHSHMFTGDVYAPMALTDAEKALGLVVGHNTWDGTKIICVDTTKAGAITGLKFKNGTLPAYDVIINWGGKAKRIKLIAQNPNKASQMAARARAGSKITQILEVIGTNGQGEFRAFIENGVYNKYEGR
jgi:hypothetical protein